MESLKTRVQARVKQLTKGISLSKQELLELVQQVTAAEVRRGFESDE